MTSQTRQALRRRRPELWLIVAVLALGLWPVAENAALRFPAVQDLTGLAPYREVHVVSAERRGPWLYLTVNFIKQPCARVHVAFVGGNADLAEFLAWQGLDGVAESYDRHAGRQTMRGRLWVDDLPLDWIEIRTRHRCAGHRIDRVMLHLEPLPR